MNTNVAFAAGFPTHFIQLSQAAVVAAAGMLWSMLWALILGFALSGIIMAFVSKRKMSHALGGSGPRELALAVGFGAASSSCSYAAAAMMKTLFQKGAHIIPALAFLLASTNLVLELSFALWSLLGWQFVVAEFIGGLFSVVIMATILKTLKPFKFIEAFELARSRDQTHDAGPHHHATDGDRQDWTTLQGWRVAARNFVSECSMLWKDIALGIGISGVIMVFIPKDIWRILFLQSSSGGASVHPILRLIENALVGPLISVLSFVCSVGNIPLASVLFHDGIGFGGAISFILADLIIIPLILIYRKYFGWKLALLVTAVFYISMVLSGLLVELIFRAIGWVPQANHEMAMDHANWFSLNSTTWLNFAFIAVAAVLLMLAKTGQSASQKEERRSGTPHCCHH